MKITPERQASFAYPSKPPKPVRDGVEDGGSVEPSPPLEITDEDLDATDRAIADLNRNEAIDRAIGQLGSVASDKAVDESTRQAATENIQPPEPPEPPTDLPVESNRSMVRVSLEKAEVVPPSKPVRRSVPEQQSLTWSPPVEPIPLPAISITERTLTHAQAAFRAELDKGTHCPCCGKPAKRYDRKLNATMVRGLIWLVRQSGADRSWINVQETGPAWLLRTKQLPTLRLWSLVERREKDPLNTKKKKSGVYRPTSFGIDFVLGRIKVPKSVFEYRGVVDAYSDEEVHVRAALGEEFDYYELMGWEAP